MADGGNSITGARQQRPLEVADLFCGAGGLSTGAERALRAMKRKMNLVGVNHWDIAIETNRRNHPEHAHRIACSDLETALPLNHVPGGRLDLLMAAPSCVFHSRARGGRPVHDQQRMDPWHVVRWCTELRVARILIENVPEFMDWGPCSLVTGRPIKSRKGEYFQAWVAALRAIGFRVKFGVLCCADYGDPTTRRRFFLIGCSDGGALDFPEPTHARKPTSDLLGERERWRGAREVIDWSRRGASIFRRKKPLKPNTIRRILAGAVKYCWPQPYLDALQALLDGRTPRLTFTREEAIALGLITAELHDGMLLSVASGGAARDVAEPMPTITTGGAGARPQLVEPLLMGVGSSNAAKPVSEPVPTITTGGDQALAVPLVAPYYGGGSGLSATSVSEPVPSVTTKARFGLADPVLMRAGHGDSDGRDPGSRVLDPDAPLPALTTSNEVAVAQPLVMRGNVGTGRTRDIRSADEPVATITTSDSLAVAAPVLVPNYGERIGQQPRTHDVDEPVPTITTANRFGIAQPTATATDEVSIDVNYRMLHWRELARATSFDDEGHVYDFAGNATQITKQIGNAVPGRTAKALVRALLAGAKA